MIAKKPKILKTFEQKTKEIKPTFSLIYTLKECLIMIELNNQTYPICLVSTTSVAFKSFYSVIKLI